MISTMQPKIFSILPGQPMAELTARYVLGHIPAEDWSHTLIFLPTRRSGSILRQALLAELNGKTAMLPRLLALADIAQEMPLLAQHPAQREELFALPPAMPEWLRRSLLMSQVMAFEKRRGSHVSAAQALALTEELIQLQDACAHAAVALTPQKLHQLSVGEDTSHWQATLQFLEILTTHWPTIEQSYGAMPASVRQVQLLKMLTRWWSETPPSCPVLLAGSTGSQPTTAALMRVIAELPRGAVLLPGYDPHHTLPEPLEEVHPYRHVQHFLSAWPPEERHVQILGEEEATENLWLSGLATTSHVPQWREMTALQMDSVAHLTCITCAQEEEEVRVAAVLIREALEDPARRIALITPDEQFLSRVAAHLARDGVIPNRLSGGSLAQTESGQGLLALLAVIDEPERMAPLMQLFQHPQTMAQTAARRSEWQMWLHTVEDKFRGVVRHKLGQLPSLPEAACAHEMYMLARQFVRRVAELHRARLNTSQWLEAIAELQGMLEIAPGEGAANVMDVLAELAHGQVLGQINAQDMIALIEHSLEESWRGGRRATHPNLSMLTPVEARLQQFDRVILANMTEAHWPGKPRGNAWLNLAHQKFLGLPAPEDAISLAAHDVLMLGSAREVFLTYATRAADGPAEPSRFLERLLAMLQLRGISSQHMDGARYIEYAWWRDAASHYEPELPAYPKPGTSQRVQDMAVTSLDYLFSDPYFLYARYVLQLKAPEEFDALPEAKDFGTLAHRAVEQLVQHWNTHARAANADELATMAQTGVAKFSDRQNVRLFWQHRLLKALEFVNVQEEIRRPHLKQVESEMVVEGKVALPSAELPLHGRVDRIEHGRDGGISIADYKTGEPPKPAEVVKGKTVQLLAYALLLGVSDAQGCSLSYWGLPGGKRAGKITALTAQEMVAEQLIAQLRAALGRFVNADTPLLARPVAGGQWGQDANPYDGISRYQEWGT